MAYDVAKGCSAIIGDLLAPVQTKEAQAFVFRQATRQDFRSIVSDLRTWQVQVLQCAVKAEAIGECASVLVCQVGGSEAQVLAGSVSG